MSHPENYDDVSVYGLDPGDEEALLLAHNECTFVWSTRDGWPVGVIMSYVWRRGRFWLTATEHRARIAAVRRDPRVSIVVTSTGSPLPRDQTVTWKGRCTVRVDQETKDWFYPELSAALNPDPTRRAYFTRFLDSPSRVILEVEPVKRIAYDGRKMGRATAQWISRLEAGT